MSAIDLTVVEDDTVPTFAETLQTDEDPTGASVTLRVTKRNEDTNIVNDSGSVDSVDANAPSADVSYQFTSNQTANVGIHRYRWILTYADGDTESFPKDEWGYIRFSEQLPDGVASAGTSGRVGPNDVYLFNELGSAPNAPAVDDWGLYVDANGNVTKIDENGTTTQVGGGTTDVVLDLGDDDANESEALSEIATSNDTNSIFTEPSADKLLIDASQNWPTADDVPDSAVDHDATTNFVANEHVDHSSVTVTGTGALTGGGDLTASRTLDVATGGIGANELANNTVTITPGTGLQTDGDGTLALGDTETYSVTESDLSLANLGSRAHSDLSDAPEEAHHPRGGYSRSDVTSTSVTASPWDSLWVDTATAGAAVTVTLPADGDTSDGDRVEVGVEDATNDTTVSPNTAQSIIGEPTLLTGGGDTITLEFKNSTSTWMIR